MASILAPLILGVSMAATAAADAARPNIIFIYTDDQRHDALGVVQAEQQGKGRFPWLRTPNLDRIAAEGLRFRNAFVVNAVCSPSRACLVSGRYSHHNGVRDNGTELPAGTRTIGDRLRAAGYHTGYFGKWHMAKQATRPGFDVWASQIGHGWFNDCHLNVNGATVESKGWLDDVVTDHAIAYIRDRKAAGPFFAIIGYKAPHTPYDRRADGADTHDYEAVEPAPVPSLAHRPALMAAWPAPKKPFDATLTTREYFRLLDSVDRNLGRLLEALEREGVAGSTVLMFSSDNGYFLGERGINDKRLGYEESMRVPLLVRWPGVVRPGGVTAALATNLDMSATIAGLAGADPAGMQGASLEPVLRDPAAEVRQDFLYEYWREGSTNQPTVFALRTADAKLLHYPENPAWDELYDLRQDPYEVANLIASPERQEQKAGLWARLRAEAISVGLPEAELKPR